MTDTIHIMLDLETWGTDPGCDLRSIGACVFNPLTGRVADNALTYGVNHDPEGITNGSFYVATDNPFLPQGKPWYIGRDRYQPKPSRMWNNLTRDPKTEQWWSEQSPEAQAAFTDPVQLDEALKRFSAWLDEVRPYEEIGGGREYAPVRLWSHGATFDAVILAHVYRVVGLPVPWHYRAPRDTRTAFDMAGIDDEGGSYRTFLTAFATGTYHHALHDAIAQARAVCAAYERVKRPIGPTIERWEREYLASTESPHWGDEIAWKTARLIADRLDKGTDE